MKIGEVMSSELLSSAELAKRLGVSKSAVFGYQRRGWITSDEKRGAQRFYDLERVVIELKKNRGKVRQSWYKNETADFKGDPFEDEVRHLTR
jgi:predicted transcriptional regulator